MAPQLPPSPRRRARALRLACSLALVATPLGAQVEGARYLELVEEAVPRLAADDADALADLGALWMEFADRWEGRAPTSAGDYAEWEGFLLASLLLADAAPDEVGRGTHELLAETEAFARRFTSPETPAQAVWRLASELAAHNDLDTAEFVTRWALETLDDAVLVTPMLWRLFAETARVRGGWDLAYERLDATEESLDRLDAAIDALPAESHEARESYEAFALSQRARLAGARGQLWLELGVLDHSIRLIEEGEELAERSGVATSREALLGILLDWKLQSGDYAGVLRELDDVDAGGLGAPVSAANRAVFDVIRAQARMQMELEDPALERRSTAMFRAALEHPELDSSLREGVLLSLAELALVDGDLERAASDLDAAAAIEARGSDVPTHRRAVRAALESELALARRDAPQALRRAYATLQEAHEALLEEWEAAPKKKRGAIGFLHTAPRRRVLGELFRMAIAVEGPEAGTRTGLEALFATQAMGMLSRDLAGDLRPTVETVRAELLGPDHGCLVYLPSEFSSHLFVLDARSLEHVELPGTEKIRRLYRPLERLLAAPSVREREARPASARLADVLLPAAVRRRMASWSALTVVGAELLGTVPFDALAVDDGTLLGERIAVTSLPSASLGLALRRRFLTLGAPRLADGSLDLFLVGTLDPGGDPGSDPGSYIGGAVGRSRLTRRRFGPEEARGLLAPFAPDRRDGLFGERCRRSALVGRTDDLARAAVVHFVAHGLYLRGRERGACLALSVEADGAHGLTTCEDVERDLDFSGLVILSACGTALGPRRLGDDDLSHLGGAFLRAGATAVVLSRAQIAYGTTLDLMERFHLRLAAGDSPAEALRSARGAATDADPAGAFQRAQLQVLGLGHQPVLGR